MRTCKKRFVELGAFGRLLFPAFLAFWIVAVPGTRAQTAAQDNKPASPTEIETQQKNLQAYIDLMRRNVRQDKSEIMGAVMALSAADAAKFWPIYSEYDAELSKLNDQRVESIKEYARNYAQMTDEEADALIQKSVAYQQQRSELLAKTYSKVKQSLGAITAARFAQVEHQLLLLIDLQIASSLPIVAQGS